MPWTLTLTLRSSALVSCIDWPKSVLGDRYERSLLLLLLGLSGIAFARFYLETHPTARLAIFEKDAGIGGVWSAGKKT